MSNLLTPVETQILEAVTGGTTATTATPRCTSSSSNDQVLATLTSLSTTLKNLGTTNNNNGGFSMTEALMLGLLMSQRSQVNVIVRRPFW
jgi:hypothetical protein